MTTAWGAPRHAYSLAEYLAAGDGEAYERLWESLGSAGRADVVIVLGAQTRLAALLAEASQGTPFRAPAHHWDRITCAPMRAFAVNAWTGMKAAGVPRRPCTHCLRTAAEALAELHLIALAAAGLPSENLANICGQAAACAR